MRQIKGYGVQGGPRHRRQSGYMESDRYREGGTYEFSDVYDEPEALIKEYDLKD